jgi:hypothetical protein
MRLGAQQAEQQTPMPTLSVPFNASTPRWPAVPLMEWFDYGI